MADHPSNYQIYLTEDELKCFIDFVEKYKIENTEIANALQIAESWISRVFASVRKNKAKKQPFRRKSAVDFMAARQEVIRNKLETYPDDLRKELRECEKLKAFFNNLS